MVTRDDLAERFGPRVHEVMFEWMLDELNNIRKAAKLPPLVAQAELGVIIARIDGKKAYAHEKATALRHGVPADVVEKM